MKTLLIAIALITLSACSLLEPIEAKSAQDVAKLIIVVCNETDEATRVGFVDLVNENLADTPHLYSTACNQRPTK